MKASKNKYAGTLLHLFFQIIVVYSTAVAQGSSNAQREPDVRVVEIDPRQYITVLYNKYETRKEFDTIWNWESRKNVPNQKLNTLDIAGKVKIMFDKLNLIKNTDFLGNISLEAEISGPKGTRQIEVNPYSEIGVTRKSIGIKSDPPSEVANKLLSMFIELSEAETYKKGLDSVIYNYACQEAYLNFKKEIDTLISRCTRGVTDVGETKLEFLSSYRELTVNADTYLFANDSTMKSNIQTQTDKNALASVLKNIESSDLPSYISYFRKPFETRFMAALNYIQDKLPLIIEYLNSFDKNGEDGLKALLSLTNIDVIKYSQIEASLIKEQDTLSKVNPASLENKTEDIKDSILLIYSEPIKKAMNSLYNLSLFRGSAIEQIILNFSKHYSKNKLSSYEDSIFTLIPGSNDYKEKLINIIDNYSDTLSILIAKKAGEQIYKKLIFASIDLGQNGATNGETLSLYLNWILDTNDSLSSSPRLEIGKYNLKEGGWEPEIADIFSLVNRINPSSTIDPTHTSPSNFKGAGGVTLMLEYLGEDKGINVLPKEDQGANDVNYKTRRRNGILNFLQPSFGINVSYVDFNTTKDVEVGVGAQLGLFANKIFFGYGINLMLLNPKDAPYYFFLGFSFANLSDLFKNSNKITSSN